MTNVTNILSVKQLLKCILHNLESFFTDPHCLSHVPWPFNYICTESAFFSWACKKKNRSSIWTDSSGMSSGSSYLLTVAQLILQDGVVWLSRGRPVQSQTALCGVALPNHRHQWRHCTDGSRIINTVKFGLFIPFHPSSCSSYRHGL